MSLVLLQMKGDYHRYLAEFKTSSDRKDAAEHTLLAYKAAQVGLFTANICRTALLHAGSATRSYSHCSMERDPSTAMPPERERAEQQWRMEQPGLAFMHWITSIAAWCCAGHRAGGPGANTPHPPGPGAQLLGVLLRDPELAREGLPPGKAGGVTCSTANACQVLHGCCRPALRCCTRSPAAPRTSNLGALPDEAGTTTLRRPLMRRSRSWTRWARSRTRTAPSSCSCCATTSPSGPPTCRSGSIWTAQCMRLPSPQPDMYQHCTAMTLCVT